MKYKRENGFVLVPEEEFDEMVSDIDFLSALHDAGVDNWEGYEQAQQMMEE